MSSEVEINISEVEINIWGQRVEERIGRSIRVRVGEHDTALGAALRSIARRTRRVVVASRHDGTSLARVHGIEVASANIYHVSLGTPVRSGGYDGAGELWISIPAGAGRSP